MSHMIELTTNDGETWEVEAFHLQAASAVFREMIGSDSLTAKSQSVPLDVDSQTFEVFLLMIRHKWTEPQDGKQIKVHVAKQLWKLCDAYDSPLVKSIFLRAISNGDHLMNGWELFELASLMNNVEPAKTAITKMTDFVGRDKVLRGFGDNQIQRTRFTRTWYESLRPEFAFGLIAAITEAYSRSTMGTASLMGSQVAYLFEPQYK